MKTAESLCMAENQTGDDYLSIVRQRLAAKKFECRDDSADGKAPASLVAHRRQFESAVLRSVDTFCFVGTLGAGHEDLAARAGDPGAASEGGAGQGSRFLDSLLKGEVSPAGSPVAR